MEQLNHVLSTLREAFRLVPASVPKLVFSADPILFASVLVCTLIVSCFVLSNVMRNYSQVDRLWSILPPALVVFYWYRNTSSDPRLAIMAGLVCLWGARLTYNFWRKGGYNWKDEDYRWQPLKAAIKPWPLWQLFNLFFICIFQLVLLFLISSPVDVAYRFAGKTKFGTVDTLLLFAHLALLLIETIADEQQWVFQNEKYRKIAAGQQLTGDYKAGFLTSGLFQFSRHPNFVCEISMWWVFYLFGVSASGQWLNWTLVGPVLLTLLFQGSTNFTEQLTAQKYPAYARYQQTTSRLLPWFPGHSIHVAQHETAHAASSPRTATVDVTAGASPEASPKKTVKKVKPVTTVVATAPGSPKASSNKHKPVVATNGSEPASPKLKKKTVPANESESDRSVIVSPKKSPKPSNKVAKAAAAPLSPKTAKPTSTKASAITSPNGNRKAKATKSAHAYESDSSSEEEVRHVIKSPKKASRPSYVSSLPVSPKGKSSKHH